MIKLILRVFAVSFKEAFEIVADELDFLGLESDLEPGEYESLVDGKDDTRIKKLEDEVCKHLNLPFQEESTMLKDIKDLDAGIYYLEIQKNFQSNEINQANNFDIREHRLDLEDYQVYTINPEDEGDSSLYFFVLEIESDEL